MNTIKILIRDLFSPLASILGVFLTLYFGIFYVPSYIEETKNEKIARMNEVLIDRIQEIIYNEKDLDKEFISTMIKGLELKSKTMYPFTINELLTQTQESFINNKFIPILQRYKYFNQIQKLKETFIENPVEEKNKNSDFDFLSVFSSILSVLITILSIIGIYLNNKKNKEIEIEAQIFKTSDKIADSVIKAVEFENRIIDLLNKLGIPIEKTNTSDMGYDFSINIKNTKYYIEVKNTRNPISMSKIEHILGKLKNLDANFILITNSALSQTAQNLVNEYNKSNKFKFISIVGNDLEEIEDQIRKI